MDLKSKALSGARWTTLGTTVRFGLQMAQVLLLARWLDQSEMGTYSILLVVISISKMFSDIGISQALIHFQDLTKKQLDTLYWINILAGVTVYILIFGLAYLIANFYKTPELIQLIQLSGVIFLVLPLGQQFQFLLQKELEFKRIAIVDVLAEMVAISTIIFLLMKGWGIYAIPYGMILYSLAYAGLYLFFGFKIHKPSLRNFDLRSCKKPIRFGLFLVGERTLNNFLVNLDKIIFGRFFGMEFLGAYELAHQLLIRPIALISTVGGKITLPLFSKIQNDHKRLNDWYLRNIQLLTFILFPVYFGVLATTGETIQLLFGEGWGSVIPIFHIIGWRGIFISIGNPIGAYLQALGRTDLGFYSNIYQFFVYGGFLMLGVLFFEWEGTLWVYIIGTTIFMMPVDYYFRGLLTKMRVRPHLWIWVKNFLLAAIMYVVVIAFKNVIQPLEFHFLLQFVLSISVGIIVYCGINYWLNPEPIKLILEIGKTQKK